MVIAVSEWRLAYMAVPKAGCSSVKSMLAHIDPNVTVPSPGEVTNKLWHAIYPTQRFRPHRFEQYRDHFWFTVVRDPIRRLLAVYTNRVVDLKNLHHSRNFKRGIVDLPVDPDPDFFFQNLDGYIQAASVIKHHALPAWLFTGKDLGRYHRVYRTEDIPQLASDLASQTGHKVTAHRENASGTQLHFDDLAPKTRDVLYPRLKAEYDHLKGVIDSPL